VFQGYRRSGARQIALAAGLQAQERTESNNVQVLERHIHQGVQHFEVPPHAVGVQSMGKLAIPELGDVNVSQFMQGQITKLSHKLRLGLLCHGLEFAAMRGRVFAHVSLPYAPAKYGLGLQLFSPEVPFN
jgi:hypothetical protein